MKPTEKQQIAYLAEMVADTTTELIAAQRDIEWYKSLWMQELKKNAGDMTTAEYLEMRNAANVT